MKRYRIVALAAALLPACASGASAVTFQPVLTGSDPAIAATAAPNTRLFRPSRLRMGVSAAGWTLPKVDLDQSAGFVSGDRVLFEPSVMPMVEVEYQLGNNWGIGGWFNPLNTDLLFRGPTADMLRTRPEFASDLLATATLNMWNAHVTRIFPNNLGLQIGVLRYHGSVNADVPNPRGNGYLNLNAGLGGTELHVWGYKSYHIWGYTGKPGYFTGGLGVRHRVSSDNNATGQATAAQGSLAFSYGPRDNVSVDVSTWFADFTDPDAFSVRVNAGVTGHF